MTWHEADSCGTKYSPVTTSCGHGNAAYDAARMGEFLDWLSDYQLLKNCAT